MSKFHVTDDGPKACKASVRECPIGGDHFESQKEAQSNFETRMTENSGILNKLKKNRDPATAHIREADKIIRSMQDDFKARDARQFTNTAYRQILKEVSQEEFDEMMSVKTSTRQAGIGYLATEDNEDKVVGVSYGGDYKSEEETGIGYITKSLAEGSFEKDDVEYVEVEGKGILYIRGESSYDQELDKKRSMATSFDRFNKYVPYDSQRRLWRAERKYLDRKVVELRAEYKGKISPLPTKREELIKAIDTFENGPYKDEITPPQGEFQTGKALSITSDNKAMMATMRKAKEAHDAGALRVGNSRNPFSRGVVFYDDRDVSSAAKANQIREKEANKAAKENIAESFSKLRQNGNAFAVSPHAGADTKDINDVRYWVNYYPARVPEGTRLESDRSVFGYFQKKDIDAMADGDFSEITRRVLEKEARDAKKSE